MKSKTLQLVLMLSFLSVSLFAQTLPVGLLENVEDAYRRQQLLGKDTTGSSYMVRPLFMYSGNDFALDPDSSRYSLHKLRKLLFSDPGSKAEIYALPVIWQQQINTHHPYGMNDGSMIQAKGYQTQLSAGLFAKIGPLTIQLRPEYVYAANTDFAEMNPLTNNVFFTTPYSKYYNNIDLPERFGTDPYSKLSLGQSSIRLNLGPASFGYSNENLWWGPGVRNSLLMTNNASGFRHFTLNTTKPAKTPIGSFEGQIIAGRLDSSGAPSIASAKFNEILKKPDDWRYISGIVITYQPKWIPNLYLGFDRTFVVYSEDRGSGLGAYLPIFSSTQKSSFDDGSSPTGNKDDAARRDQYFSAFARWVLPEAKAEVYFQFGRNDHSNDLRDLLVEPEHSRAYVVGFRKLVPLTRPDEYIQVGAEVTQLEIPATRDSRAVESWYTHYQVKHGYTNQGQVLGAGAGPGGNMQTLDVSWNKGFKRIGIQLERWVHNNDLFYKFAYASLDKNQYINRHWVDLALGMTGSWTFNRFVVNGQLSLIRSLNYQYRWKDGKPGADYWDWNKQDANNVHMKVGLMYLW